MDKAGPREDLPTLADIRAGGKAALARALTAIETHEHTLDLACLLDQAIASARARTVGITGPPGVGKSTLTSVLIRRLRAAGETVGVIAVDPSSRTTGGALLGDRTRMMVPAGDRGVFVRSMAARSRLGGLSDHAIAAIVLMRAVMDHVIVETVGIGQSEADVALAVDTVILCVQPGSGDSLQFMKAGIMELPDIIVVTKSDMKSAARRACADIEGALSLNTESVRSGKTPILAVSAEKGDGIDALLAAIDDHHADLVNDDRLAERRARQSRDFATEAVRLEFGAAGISQVADMFDFNCNQKPFQTIHAAFAILNDCLR